METARAFGYRLPGYLWKEWVRTANYLTNWCPTKALKLVTSLERYNGLKLDLSHLRIYGSSAYVHIPREKRSELEVKSIPCTLVGYDDESKAYRCYEPQQKRILITKDMVFNETVLGLPSVASTDLLDLLRLDYLAQTDKQQLVLPEPSEILPEIPSLSEEPSFPPDIPSKNHQSPSPSPPPLALAILHGSSCLKQPPIRLDDYLLNLAMAREIPQEPQLESLTYNISVTEAVRNPAWFSAMKDEISSIQENKTYDLVELPAGQKPISARWVFKLKTGS